MHENQVGCCLPKLFTYSFYGALGFGLIGSIGHSYADIKQSTSVIYAVALGVLLPFHGKIWDICIYPEKSRASFLASSLVVTMTCLTSTAMAAIFTKIFCKDLSPKTVLKLTAIDFGIATIAVALTSLVSICVMRQYLVIHSQRAPKAKTLIV